MVALRLLLCSLAGTHARYWSITAPSDGETVVTDNLHIAAVYAADPPDDGRAFLEAPGGAPTDFRVCVSMASAGFVDDYVSECFEDWGEWGHGPSGVFATSARVLDVLGRPTPADAFAHIELKFWVAAGDDDAPLGGNVLAQRFRHADFAKCAANAARDPRPAPPSPRRIFDVFPFFNERDILEVRLHEHDDIVDVYVPIESATTHAGEPRALRWRGGWESDARFARFLPRIRPFTADLDLGGRNVSVVEAARRREEAQRDAARAALVAAGAGPRDLVLLSDADEIGRSAALKNVLRCVEWRDAGGGGAAFLPVALEMNWHAYDFRWRSRLQWGMVAKEGAVLVDAASLGVGADDPSSALTASDWRRMMRPDRVEKNADLRGRGRAWLEGGGWHASSFGGVDALAEKLESYIEASTYNTSFYRDRDRLRRLVDGGVGHFELVSMDLAVEREDEDGDERRYFSCGDVDDAPAYAVAHARGHLAGLFGGTAPCPAPDDDARALLAVDVVKARHEASVRGSYVISNLFNEKGESDSRLSRPFSRTVACPRDAGGGLAVAAFARGLEDECMDARLSRKSCGQARAVFEGKCRDALDREPAGSSSPVSVFERIEYVTKTHFPVFINEVPKIVTLRADTDVPALVAGFCAEFDLAPDQCTSLEERLGDSKPFFPWLGGENATRVWTRDAWLDTPVGFP